MTDRSQESPEAAPTIGFLNDAMRGGMLLVFRWLQRWRIRIGLKIVGGGYQGAVMRLWLIRERAMTAITQGGGVILADCPALAEALYEPIPGQWRFTIEQIDAAAHPLTGDRNANP